MKHVKKLLHRGLILFLTLMVLLPLAGPGVVVEVEAATKAEINALKQNASSLAAQKKELQSQLKEIRADKSKALEQKNLLEKQIGLIEDEIDNIQDQIRKYDELILQKEGQLAENEAERETQYELFCQRIRMMEEEGEVSYWAILFDSSDFSALLDNFMMVEEIIEYDNSIMERLLALQQQIETEKAELEQARADQETAKKAQEAAKAELAAQESEVDKLISEISTQEDKLEAAEAALKKAADAVDAEIRAKEKEMAAQITNVPSESGFLWPLPGYNTLSSLYGGRKHPVTGKPNNHTGIDIPAPRGVKILAAKSGVVTTSKYNNSYGNYVVVSHSDGTSTLYAHMSKRSVKEGQTVKQGATLGLVGTTGSSTGNHLHFEIRVNGSRRDPVDYFKDMTLYARAKGVTKRLT